jgi:hypothetical protein
VTVRPKTCVWSRCVPGVARSRPVEGVDVRLLCLSCGVKMNLQSVLLDGLLCVYIIPSRLTSGTDMLMYCSSYYIYLYIKYIKL